MSNSITTDLLQHLNSRKDSPQARSGTDLGLESNIPFGIPTAIPELDISIGRPGYPAGRIVELYGFESTGKTTAALHAIASCQKIGGISMFIDTEYCFDSGRAEQCGINVEDLIVLTASSIEEIFEHIQSFTDWIQKNEWTGASIIVVDSITGVKTAAEMEKDFRDVDKVGATAKAIRSGLQKLTGIISESKTLAIFVNHAIAKINTMFGGKTKESAGGHGLRFYSSVRVNFNFTNQIFDGKGEDRTRRGQGVVIEVEKNKVASTGKPRISVELTEKGFDLYHGLWNAMLTVGCLNKVTSQSYLYKPEDLQVTKARWSEFVDGKGGPWEVYKWFLEKCIENETVAPYGLISSD